MDDAAPPTIDRLVTVEAQSEVDLLSGERQERIFLKLYVAARESGLLAAISDRDWKTLCVLATYMDSSGYCHPSQDELAKAMGCSRQMANERVKHLADFRFQGRHVLILHSGKGKRKSQGKWTGNAYQVLPVSSLRIFDNPAADDQAPAKKPVSRNLDTVADTEPTVSSHTVTVALDTNKNQISEQELSNFEDVHTQKMTAAVETADNPRSQRDPGKTSASSRALPRAARMPADALDSANRGEYQLEQKTAALSDSGTSQDPVVQPAGRTAPLASPSYYHFREMALRQRAELHEAKQPKQQASRRGETETSTQHDAGERESGALATVGEVIAAKAVPAVPHGPVTPRSADQHPEEFPWPSQRGRPPGSVEEREQVGAFMQDFCLELGDQSQLSSAITRCLALFKQASAPRERWADLLYSARALTQEHSAQIRKTIPDAQGRIAAKNKVPYFFAVLTDLLKLKEDRPANANTSLRAPKQNEDEAPATGGQPAALSQSSRFG